MDEYDIEDVTVVGLAPGGTALLIRLDGAKGQIMLRMPIEKAKHFGDIMEWATSSNEPFPTQSDSKTMGEVENVTRVIVGHPLGGKSSEVFVHLETETGPRGFLLDAKVSDELLAGLSMLAQKGHTTH